MFGFALPVMVYGLFGTICSVLQNLLMVGHLSGTNALDTGNNEDSEDINDEGGADIVEVEDIGADGRYHNRADF